MNWAYETNMLTISIPLNQYSVSSCPMTFACNFVAVRQIKVIKINAQIESMFVSVIE